MIHHLFATLVEVLELDEEFKRGMPENGLWPKAWSENKGIDFTQCGVWKLLKKIIKK